MRAAPIALCALLLIGATGCDQSEPLLREAVSRTTPRGATAYDIATAATDLHSKTFTWQLELPEGWRDYAGWLRQGLEDYELRAVSDTALTFSRTTNGGALQLHVQVITGGLPSHAKATLVMTSH